MVPLAVVTSLIVTLVPLIENGCVVASFNVLNVKVFMVLNSVTSFVPFRPSRSCNPGNYMKHIPLFSFYRVEGLYLTHISTKVDDNGFESAEYPTDDLQYARIL